MEFENLLGKDLLSVEKIIGIDFVKKDYGYPFYIGEYFNNDFFGMECSHITLLTDDKDMLQSISIHFPKILNRKFYDLFIKKCGNPDNIQVIENRKIESKSFVKDDNGKVVQTLRKSTFDLREGSFEEKPLYIIWKKDNYEIKAFLRHKQNISEITFSM
ncbi:hypothetical protein [uncultured Algibacter sp.]|uniref:hypothetical protein n=1 Tax=uncultured Algibacter sp. TaxID=298659 RepID=UPI003216841C